MERVKNFFLKNTSTRQIILKNTIWIGVSTTIIKIFRAVVIIYAARLLGTESYGIFTYATGIVAIFAVFSDMGLSSVLVRELSKDREKEKEYFSTAIIIKFIFLSGMMLLLLGSMPFLSKYGAATKIIPIVGISIVLESLRTFLYSIYRSKNSMQGEAVLAVVNEIFCALLIVFFFLKDPSPLSLAYSFMIGNALGLLVTMFFTKKYLAEIKKYFTKELMMPIVKLALPFAILGVFGIFMTNIDSVIIGYFGNEHMLGLFGAAQRPISILYILPGILASSLLPVISRFLKDGRDLLTSSIVSIASASSLTIALPLVAGGIIIASPLISVVFGASYAGSVMTFKILLLTLLFVFPGTLFAEVLIAQNKQKVFLFTGITGALLNIIFDIMLIPKYGIEGSAVATVIAQAVVNILFYIKAKEHLSITVAKNIHKSIFATLAMSVFAFYAVKINTPILLLLPVSALIYTGMLFILKDATLIELRRAVK